VKKSILLLVLSPAVLFVSLVAAPYSFAGQPGGVHGGGNHGGAWGGAQHGGWAGWHGGYHPGYGWRGGSWGYPGWGWSGWGFGGWGWGFGAWGSSPDVGWGGYWPAYPNSGYQGTGSVHYPCTLYYPEQYCSASYPSGAPAVHAIRPGSEQTARDTVESGTPSSRNLTEENPSSH
jgi:hypothetical protein